jgi:hypothetical protein
MKNLSSAEEAKLIKAVEQAIQLSNRDMSPNAAIEKVARDYSYKPPYIRLMVNAFNKSKAVHVFKSASQEDRVKPFELADANTIIQSIYASPEEALEKAAFELPKADFSKVDTIALEKTAKEHISKIQHESYKDRFFKNLSEGSQANIIYKYAIVQKAAQEKLESNVRLAHLKMMEVLDETTEHVKFMPERDFQKVAQNVINSYPRFGQKLVKLISNSARKDIGELQKTANAAIFPTREPYLSISKLVDCARDVTKAKNALIIFTKEANSGVLNTLVADMASAKMQGLGVSSKALEDILKKKSPRKELKEELDPTYFNALKEMDTRRNFMNLALYDDDLNKYEFPALVKAYNDAAQMLGPDSLNNRVVLRNMMLHNLETGGIKDPFTIATELSIGKTMDERQKLLSDIDKNKATMADLARKAKEDKPIDYYTKVKRDKDTFTGNLNKWIKETTDKAQGKIDAYTKERRELDEAEQKKIDKDNKEKQEKEERELAQTERERKREEKELQIKEERELAQKKREKEQKKQEKNREFRGKIREIKDFYMRSPETTMFNLTPTELDAIAENEANRALGAWSKVKRSWDTIPGTNKSYGRAAALANLPDLI